MEGTAKTRGLAKAKRNYISKAYYLFLAIQLKVFLRLHRVCFRLIWVAGINALGHVSQNLLDPKHTIGI